MKQIICLSEAVGKTILKIKEGEDSVCLFFTDGTYIYILAEMDWDDPTINLNCTPAYREQLFYEIIDQQEYDRLMKEVADKNNLLHEQHEREIYERLKKKFEEGKT